MKSSFSLLSWTAFAFYVKLLFSQSTNPLIFLVPSLHPKEKEVNDGWSGRKTAVLGSACHTDKCNFVFERFKGPIFPLWSVGNWLTLIFERMNSTVFCTIQVFA